MTIPILELQHLGADRLALVKIVVRHCLMPHPDTVRKLNGPVFPSIRDQKNRLTIGELDGKKVLLDDNVTPRWALLWSHGQRATHHLPGWTFAHVWAAPKLLGAYTHLANLCMMPEYFGSLSDKMGPLCPFLRFHAWDRYGWSPSMGPAEEPEGYRELSWNYLPLIDDPISFIQDRMDALQNQRVLMLREITSYNKGVGSSAA